MEALKSDGRIALRDIEAVYEALFLRAATGFEVFLEQLFFDILHEKAKYTKKRVALRMRPLVKAAIEEIVMQKQKYLTWVPFENTEDRAKLYLKDGKPFSELDGSARSSIKTIAMIRNAIAHKSAHAEKEFAKLTGSLLLLPREKSPAGFLRSQMRSNPVQIRFEYYVYELKRIATLLC